jgi:hypothetical protein
VPGAGQRHQAARRAGGDIEPLFGVARETREAEFVEQTPVPRLAQDAAGLEIGRLEERNDRAQPAVEIARRRLAQALGQRGEGGKASRRGLPGEVGEGELAPARIRIAPGHEDEGGRCERRDTARLHARIDRRPRGRPSGEGTGSHGRSSAGPEVSKTEHDRRV